MAQRTIVGTVEASAPGVGVALADRRTRMRIDPGLVAAVAAVWLLWGSTFAAMRFAEASFPSYVMSSLRFGIAGALLYVVCLVRGKGRIERGELVPALVTGTTLLLLGNGTTAWTVQFIPTGMNSLLVSLSPVWMAAIAFLWGGERPTRVAVGGMVLGFLGLALLLQPKGAGSLPLVPMLLTIGSSIAWAFGSIAQRRSRPGTSLVRATALQMLVGGVLLGLQGALLGQWRHFDVHAVTPAAAGGLAWLVVCGSLFAYSAYLYTMRVTSTALASTYAYVNPIVAVTLGMLLFHERFTPVEALAAAVILVGVALMMLPRRRRSATA